MNGEISILVVEDDPVIVEFLQTGLKYEGYKVSAVHTGKDGLQLLLQESFHLLILDIMLPDIDGFEICRRIRSLEHAIPILLLSVKKEIADRVNGLDSGADDYWSKPFSFDELLAHIRALLRRSGAHPGQTKIQSGDICLDTQTRKVYSKNESIDLTPTEFSLLELFIHNPYRVFTRETLLNRIFGYSYDGGTNIIDVHIYHLRKKLDDKSHQLICTHYAVGYAFYPEKK